MSLKITPVLCRPQVMDNYAYIITDSKTNLSAVIDASESDPIINYCQKHNITLSYVLTTHHHFDHREGNDDLKQKFGLKIVAPAAEAHLIGNVDIELKDGDAFSLGESTAKIIGAAGHTNGHILYYFAKDKALFTGDTLFNLCIGGLFEGTIKQMWESLQKIKNLPDDTLFYPGHEYTAYQIGCLKNNPNAEKYLTFVKEKLQQNLPIVAMNLGLEKKCNPYLKCSTYKEFKSLF